MVVDLLKENGEPDEYTEALDLISRLVNPKYGKAASDNATILLGDVKTVELLLDLLEHEDGLVNVECCILSHYPYSNNNSNYTRWR